MLPVLMFLVAAHAACASAGDACLIKAGFVTKFPSYITWPASASQGRPGDFLYCVAADSPLVPHLEALVPLAVVNGAPPSIRVVQELRRAEDCNVLVLPPIPVSRLRGILEHLADRPVLLIGDAPGLARVGVHINLYRDGDRVRKGERRPRLTPRARRTRTSRRSASPRSC